MSDYQGNIIIKNPATPTGPSAYGSAPGMWKLNEVAYWIKQGVWPSPNIVPDTYFPYVSLLLSSTSLGNANNNLFVDSSGAFNPISRNGNTTQGSFTPYSTNWSNYFDGSGDYLTVPDNAALDFGTGDFTIEMWINAQNLSSIPMLFHKGLSSSGWFFQTSATTLYFGQLDSNRYTTWTVSLADNGWYHIALTRVGAVLNVFVNGVSQGAQTVTNANLSNDNGDVLNIGRFSNGSYQYQGYISNYRVVKGTAVYTSNFTPPTSALTAISGTSLLTCQSNRFRDASTNNFTITVNGNTSVQDFSPFSPAYPGMTYNQSDITNWSGFFDGTGDYLSVANSSANNLGTSDFTIELWFQSNTGTMNTHACLVASYSNPSTGSWAFKAQSGNTGYIQFASYGPSWNDWVTTTNIAADRQWHHCAVTRSGNTLRIFVDGAVAGTWDISGASSFTGGGHPLTTGFMAQDSTSYLNGNLSNVRIVQGTALYTSAFTPPTSPLTAISGTVYLTCQNAAFTDNSTNNLVITQNGNPTVAGNSPFNTVGYWSNYFDGTGDYLTVPYNSSLQFPGDFTVECWVYPVSRVQNFPCIVGNYSTYTSNGGFAIFAGHNSANTSKYNVAFNGSFPVIQSTDSIVYNAWAHIALVRSGSTITLYVNGVANGTATSSATVTGTSNNWWIGTAGDALSTGAFNGYISNLRAVKGTAVYTANFTPSTTPLTAISGTSLLTCQNGSFKDNSTNAFTVTRNGDTLIQSYNPFYTSTTASNGGSVYLDGSGDYLTVPDNPSLNLAGGVFTLEAWIYPNGNYSDYRTIITKRILGGSTTSYQMYLRQTSGYLSFFNGTEYVSSSTPIANAWNHVAAVYDGTNINLYLNGARVLQSATTITNQSANLYIGSFPTYGENVIGYLSDVRVLKGVQAYTGTTYTVPTAPANPTPSTVLLLNGMNAGIYDATAINDMETVGNAQVSAAVYKYGTGSMAFDGSGDYLVSRGNTILLGSGNFTVEFWVYFNAVNNSTVKYLYDFRTASATSASFLAQEASNAWTYWNGAGSSVTTGLSGSTFATGQWYHVAITRSSNVLYCFVNGTKVSSDPADSSNYASATLTLGARYSGSDGLNGYIDDVRLTAGVARYTANFTPPTQAFPTY
jgi:hypothetical protein